MILGQVFNEKAIKLNLESEEKDEVLEEMVELLVSVYPSLNRDEILESVISRESKMSTGIKTAIAVPHGKTDAIEGVVGAIGISRTGIDYDSLDGKPVHLVFMMLSSKGDCEYHLRVLRHLSQVMDSKSFYEDIINQTTAQGVYATLCKYDSETK